MLLILITLFEIYNLYHLGIKQIVIYTVKEKCWDENLKFFVFLFEVKLLVK